jgi:hypothetical protein
MSNIAKSVAAGLKAFTNAISEGAAAAHEYRRLRGRGMSESDAARAVFDRLYT